MPQESSAGSDGLPGASGMPSSSAVSSEPRQRCSSKETIRKCGCGAVRPLGTRLCEVSLNPAVCLQVFSVHNVCRDIPCKIIRMSSGIELEVCGTSLFNESAEPAPTTSVATTTVVTDASAVSTAAS